MRSIPDYNLGKITWKLCRTYDGIDGAVCGDCVPVSFVSLSGTFEK